MSVAGSAVLVCRISIVIRRLIHFLLPIYDRGNCLCCGVDKEYAGGYEI